MKRSCLRTRPVTTSIVFSACVVLAAPVLAADAVRYEGTWTCDASAKMLTPPMNVPVTAVLDGDVLTVTRVVHKAGTFDVIGQLTGSAPVRNGSVAVDLASPALPITSRMSGTVSDKEIALTGGEHLNLGARGEDDRRCWATLRR